MTREKAHQLRGLIEKASASLEDSEALEAVELFPAWESGKAWAAGARLRYGGELYRVLQDHTAQNDWTPDRAVSLYVRIAVPGEIPDWVQPLGAQDAYQTGDRVRHMGSIWESLVDNNVWEPGAAGTDTLWKEVSE